MLARNGVDIVGKHCRRRHSVGRRNIGGIDPSGLNWYTERSCFPSFSPLSLPLMMGHGLTLVIIDAGVDRYKSLHGIFGIGFVSYLGLLA